MSEPFLGEIRMFGGTFAPRDWEFCDGQLLPINQNQSLYSLLGTTYGGDGRTNFGLPDLRGRIPVHPGDGPGLTPRFLGEKSGSETHFHKTLPVNGEVSQDSGPNNALADSASSMQPYQCISFIIAVRGLFPSRN